MQFIFCLTSRLHADDQSELAQIKAAREVNEQWQNSFDKTGKYPDKHDPAEHHAILGALLRIPPDSPNFLTARALSDQLSARDVRISRLERAKAPNFPEDASIELGRLDRSYGLLEGSFTLKNPNKFAIADVKIHCDITASSGTSIDQKDFIVFEAVPAKGQKMVRNFKFGYWPQQGKSIGCHATGYVRR
jgi:hypothetical protein